MKIEGFYDIKPEINEIRFDSEHNISFYFKDGRILTAPVSAFPSIKKLNREQREKYQILGSEGFTFDDCDEVFAVEQVLGNYDNYRHS